MLKLLVKCLHTKALGFDYLSRILFKLNKGIILNSDIIPYIKKQLLEICDFGNGNTLCKLKDATIFVNSSRDSVSFTTISCIVVVVVVKW